jgi:hypothetical protein
VHRHIGRDVAKQLSAVPHERYMWLEAVARQRAQQCEQRFFHAACVHVVDAEQYAYFTHVRSLSVIEVFASAGRMNSHVRAQSVAEDAARLVARRSHVPGTAHATACAAAYDTHIMIPG